MVKLPKSRNGGPDNCIRPTNEEASHAQDGELDQPLVVHCLRRHQLSGLKSIAHSSGDDFHGYNVLLCLVRTGDECSLFTRR